MTPMQMPSCASWLSQPTMRKNTYGHKGSDPKNMNEANVTPPFLAGPHGSSSGSMWPSSCTSMWLQAGRARGRGRVGTRDGA